MLDYEWVDKKKEKGMSTLDLEKLSSNFGENPSNKGYKVDYVLAGEYNSLLQVKEILEKKYNRKLGWTQLSQIFNVVLQDMKKTKHKTKAYGEGTEHFKQRRKSNDD